MSLLLAFTVPCIPMPKQRARKGPHGWYTPTETVNYEKFVIHCARTIEEPRELGDRRPPLYRVRPGLAQTFEAERVRIVARFFFPHRRRVDIDNVQKAVGDALVRGHVIRDDSHTVLVGWQVEAGYDRINPRAEIEIHDAGPAPAIAKRPRAPKATKKKPYERPAVVASATFESCSDLDLETF